MKKAIMAALVVLGIGAGAANADPFYRVELSADNALSSCAIAGDGSGIVQIHMFLTGSTGVTAVAFGAYIPSCWAGATFLGDVLAEPWLSIGTTQDALGLSIAFGECRTLPVYLGYINIAGVPAASCCELEASGPSNGFYPTPEVADCSFAEFAAAGSRVIINANSTCPCQQPLATEQTTWGRVKSLYR